MFKPRPPKITSPSKRVFFLSLLVAGLFFYLGSRFHTREVLAPDPSTTLHLKQYHLLTNLMRSPEIAVELAGYRSDFDGTVQSVVVLRPTQKEPDKVFFFFHGMSGDAVDAAVVQVLVKELNGMVVAPGGRGPSWVSDALLADAEQVIRKYHSSFSGYYLIGISMGGTQALALAGLLPEDLRKSLLGVLAGIPGSDLAAIAEASSNADVRASLRASVEGKQDRLKTRSPDQLISRYPSGLPFAIFFRTDDTILDASAMRRFIERLRSSGHPTSVFRTPGEHSFPYQDFGYEDFFNSLGQNSDHFKVPVSS